MTRINSVNRIDTDPTRDRYQPNTRFQPRPRHHVFNTRPYERQPYPKQFSTQPRFRKQHDGPTCYFCHRQGHTQDQCWTKNPALRPNKRLSQWNNSNDRPTIGDNRRPPPKTNQNPRPDKKRRIVVNNINDNNKDYSTYTCVTSNVILQGKKYSTIIDTGASISIIQGELFDRLDLNQIEKNYHIIDIITAANREVMPLRCLAKLSIQFGRDVISHWFRVIDMTPNQLLIGTDLLTRLRAIIDLKECMLTLPSGESIPLQVFQEATNTATISNLKKIRLAPRCSQTIQS